MNAKLVLSNVPTTDFKRSLGFYAALFGIDPGEFIPNKNSEVEQYYRPILADGMDLTVTAKADSRDTTTTYYAVDDLKGTLERLCEAGGQVIQEPEDMPERERRENFGRRALMVDPDGNYLGLLELQAETAQRYFRLGEHRGRYEEELNERLSEARQG